MKLVLISYFLFLVFSETLAQTKSQIKKAKEYVSKTGMSIKDAKNAARAQGFSEKQINSVIQKELEGKKINKSKDLQPNSNFLEQGNFDISRQDNNIKNDLIKQADLDIIEDTKPEKIENNELNLASKPQNSTETSKYFGYDIFQRDPSIFQATSFGAVDPNYVIGPKDEIIVMLWGETQFRQVLTVDREGFVFIPEIGQVFVNGLNLNLLESKLFRVLSQAYASLNPQGRKATTFFDVSLGNLRPLRIQVLGEVSQPGAYTISPSTTVFSSLYYFNGPSTSGSLRDIKLIRGGKEIAVIDFYDFLLTGKKPNDVKLQLDDVVFIPKRKNTVTIKGSINRPGIYELKNNESLYDLINIAGDLKITAYTERAQIDRIVPFSDREKVGMDRMFVDVNLKDIIDSKNKINLLDGDKIEIFSILNIRQNIAILEGAVTRPGTYDLGDSLRVRDLILKADSLLNDAYMDRVDLIRVKSDYGQELIKLSLTEVMNGNKESNIFLQGLDRVFVYGKEDMVSTNFVTINGHVKFAGQYPLLDNMTVYDLVFKYGGFFDEEFKKQTYLKRAELVRDDNNKKVIIPFDLDLVLQKEDIAQLSLEPNDYIKVYSKNEIEGAERFVTITGHVKNPGRYELFEKNMSAYDLIFKAGGIEDTEFLNKTYLDRADLIRFNENGIDSEIIPFNVSEIINRKKNIELKSRDLVRIYSKDIFIRAGEITVNGVIKNPGRYVLKQNMNIEDLILEAGGIKDGTYRCKIEIARIDPKILNENIYSTIINYDLIIKNSDNRNTSPFLYYQSKQIIEKQNIKLNPYDIISIRPDPYFQAQRKVLLSGSVYYPGEYALLGPNEKIFDLIQRAGGLLPNAHSESIVIKRNNRIVRLSLPKVLNNKKHKNNINLVNNDTISVKQKENIITVRGEVMSPGTYAHINGAKLADYIKSAGGFSLDYEEKNIIVIEPNGLSKRKKRLFSNPRIKDGSIIIVGRKKEVEPFDKTEFTKEVASILGSFAQVISLIFLASR